VQIKQMSILVMFQFSVQFLQFVVDIVVGTSCWIL